MKYLSAVALLLSGTALALSPPVPQKIHPMPELGNAPVTLLLDLESGQPLHAREADRRFLPASVTKVMTAFVVFEMIAAGDLAEDDVFTVSSEIADEWYAKGSTMFLRAGDRVKTSDLLRGITSVSANDGCIVLAVGTAGSVDGFVGRMNAAARELGMENSHFGTPNGWPDEGRTFVSANDLAKLADALIARHPQLYRRYFGQPGFSFNGFTQRNHDPITGVVKGADGIKTGYTREAGSTFLGSAQRGDRRLVMVLAGIEGEQERARIAREYIEWGFAGFENRRLFDNGAIVGRARVQGGNRRSVELRLPEGAFASLPVGGAGMELTLHYRGPVEAPFRAGDRIAELEIAVEGLEPYRIPLEAAQDVDKANPFQRIVNAVLGVFA